jgi:cytochrome P450
MAMKAPPAERDLLQRFIESKTLDAQATVGLIMSTISGAADTTATTICATLYYLLKNPFALEKLRRELREANIGKPVPQYAETKNLPYLDAVIKESMRLFPVLNWPMERRVPPGGATLAGMYFPEGTSVGCSLLAVHMNRALYGPDVDAFRPERFLEGDAETLRKREISHLGFSKGKRVCLGQNIAVLQMKKAVPALVMGFQVCAFEIHDGRACSELTRADYLARSRCEAQCRLCVCCCISGPTQCQVGTSC